MAGWIGPDRCPKTETGRMEGRMPSGVLRPRADGTVALTPYRRNAGWLASSLKLQSSKDIAASSVSAAPSAQSLIRRPSSRIRQSVLLTQRYVLYHKYICWALACPAPKPQNKQRCQKENLVSSGDFCCSLSFSFFLSHFSLKVSHAWLEHATH